MQLSNGFLVSAPIDQVWATLMDFERVASCVPGAEVKQITEDTYQVGMRVKVGPMTMQYAGELEVVERDLEGRKAVVRGHAQEARGQGTAQATVELRLTEDGKATKGTADAEVKLSGRAAAMGGGVIRSVADQIMVQFSQNLQNMLNQQQGNSHAGEPHSAAGPPAAGNSPAGSGPAGHPVPVDLPAAVGHPAPDSLDAVALARGVIGAQLRRPQVAVGLIVPLLLMIAFRLGRRSGRRRLTR
ncbi:MAG: SRPBCC family protein [Candidatus Dormiibacterota bacterium]